MSGTNETPIVPHGTKLPPARPGVRYVPVPWIGIVIADDEVRHRVDHHFYWPMIVLALLILPLLFLDIFYISARMTDPTYVPGRDWVVWATRIGLGVVWLAFLIEFLVKIAIAECRLQYVKRNWLDVVIIAAPPLRAIRAAKVVRTAKIFTLRGVGFKFARYVFTVVIGMEATDRMLDRFGMKRDGARPAPDRMTRYDLIDEVRRLRRINDAWEQWYDLEKAYLADRDVEPAALVPAPRDVVDEEEPVDHPTGVA